MQNIIDGIRRYYPVSDNSLNILFSMCILLKKDLHDPTVSMMEKK